MKDYFSKTRADKGGKVQEGSGYSDSKAWLLGTRSRIKIFLQVDIY